MICIKNSFLITVIPLSILFTIAGCGKTSTTSNCENERVTYSNSIKAIMQSRCVKCHGASAPNLESLEGVKSAINLRDLICSIEWSSSTCKDMPADNSGKLSDDEISKIKSWKCLGFPN